jgi:4-hydroxyacetophenone monooxygenase
MVQDRATVVRLTAQANAGLRRDLARALEDANVPVLVAMLAHLTTDRLWLDAPYTPNRANVLRDDPTGGLAPEYVSEVRAAALQVLIERRENGQDWLGRDEHVDPSMFAEIMSACVGEPVPAEYEPMVREEIGLSARAVNWRVVPQPEVSNDFQVLIIGAGMSGLCAAIQLRELGVSYIVLEKNPSVGGTWFENSYPGCRVDVPNHFYSYSFAPNPGWSNHFSERDELFSYFADCATEYDLLPHIRFNHEVVAARFDAHRQRWVVDASTPDGATSRFESNVLITAVGQLNRPLLPELQGLADFDGPVFHSATWRHDVELAGKSVAVVGTGASAMQFAPAVASLADKTTIFQRSPHWTVPNPLYHRKVSDETKWLLTHVPAYAGWYRFALLWKLCDGLWPALQVDPEWSGNGQSINAVNERVRVRLTAYIERQLSGRPDLVAKALPPYPPYSKRLLVDNNWYEMLKRPDVSLVTDTISYVTPDAIVTADGTQHPVDAIICGTGFAAAKVLWPMDISGKSGEKLDAVWNGDDARAYLGIAMPGFPNLFFLYGPNTNLGHGGSIIFHAECQARYIAQCIRELLEGGHGAMECRSDVFADYQNRLDTALNGMIWSQVEVGSWYRNSRRRVVANSPWRLVDYWNMTRELSVADWTFEAPR